MKTFLTLPFSIILLSSCSFVDDYKSDLKEELKTVLKAEIKADLKDELTENNKFKLEIIDDTLLGVSNFKIEKPSYGGCSLSGNLKFNIDVPKDFSGYIYDPSATFTYRGIKKIMGFNDEYFEGKSIRGVSIYSYISSDEENTDEGSLLCSINSSDDIKLKSFSKKVMVFPAIKPLLKWKAFYPRPIIIISWELI